MTAAELYMLAAQDLLIIEAMTPDERSRLYGECSRRLMARRWRGPRAAMDIQRTIEFILERQANL